MEISISDFSKEFITNLLRGNSFDERIIVALIETLGNKFMREIFRNSLLKALNEGQERMSDKFLQFGDEFWIEKEVIPWELEDFVSEKKRKELEIYPILFIHPMQPDIDILFGPEVNGERLTPLMAVEVKLFKGIEKGKRPKARGRGFYEGMGEAIALLTYGVDFVELWHFFFIPLIKEIPPHLPPEVEKEVEKKLSKKLEKNKWRIIDAGTYAGFVRGLIESLDLPLGYRCFAISMEEDGKIWLHEDVGSNVLPKENPFLVKRSEAALKIRSLIKEALNVKEGNNG